jgi:pre-mRNA-processing factor 17
MTDGSSQSCLAFAPTSPSSLLVGSANNIVSEYDTRTGGGAAVRKYSGHSSLVNCITFLGNSSNFVTSSDDKSIIAWDLGNTTMLKKLEDFHMSLAAHPSGDHFIGQASHPQDTIVGYSSSQGFKKVMQKTFTGHNSRGGHAIQLGFSHDGALLASGDGTGKVHVWDWDTTELKASIDAHAGCPCIGVQWHPFETSMLATCSWDGTVRLFNSE